jgi:hypothetical protein
MLATVDGHRIRQVVAHNAEPFADEAGPRTKTREEGDVPGVEPGELLLESEYGRLWAGTTPRGTPGC